MEAVAEWNGKEPRKLTAELLPGVLHEGVNELEVESLQ